METIDSTRKILRYIAQLEQQRRRYLDEKLQDKKLYGSMYMFILFLEREPGSSQNNISSHFGKDKSIVARLCRKLEVSGYIFREQSQKDRRENKLYLTESGKALLPVIIDLLQKWRKTAMAGMDENDQKELLRLLERMMINVKGDNMLSI